MQPFHKIKSKCVILAIDNIDTDQIIPARFLKVTDKAGLGQWLFADWRYNSQGEPLEEFALNQPENQGAEILIAGDNFGCGSSREHAPWALKAWGLRAIISTSFADIFRSNALKNGLLTVEINRQEHASLLKLLGDYRNLELVIDLQEQRVYLPNGREISFLIDQFSRRCLLQGMDELGFLMAYEAQISAYEKAISSPSEPALQT